MNWVHEYLKTLKLEKDQLSLAFLEKITSAHLHIFPFENISKLLSSNDRIPTPDELLYLRKHLSLAGTCYTINANLYLLLKELQFNCRLLLLGCVHLAILVQLNDDAYYVDCGSTAPIFKPLLLGKETERNLGNARVEIIQTAKQSFEHKRYLNERQTGITWTFNTSEHLTLNDFTTIMQKSCQHDGSFMQIIRCQLYQTEQKRSVSLLNNTFTAHYQDGTTIKKQLDSVTEIEELLHSEFRLPHIPVRAAIMSLEKCGIPIFAH